MSSSTDPVCPECGEPVGLTSTYCMHCDAEFDSPANVGTDDESENAGDSQSTTADAGDWGDSDQAVTEHPNGLDEGGPGDEGHTEIRSADGDATTSTTTGSGTGTDPTPDTVGDYGTTGESSETAEPAGSDDGGTGRTLLQSIARIGAVLLTVLVGLVTTAALMILTVEVIELWLPIAVVALVGIVTAGIVVARQDTGIDALADALYITAAVVVGLPFVFTLLLPTSDPIGERIVVGLAFSFFGAFVGVPAFVVGWILQPDDEEIPWN